MRWIVTSFFALAISSDPVRADLETCLGPAANVRAAELQRNDACLPHSLCPPFDLDVYVAGVEGQCLGDETTTCLAGPDPAGCIGDMSMTLDRMTAAEGVAVTPARVESAVALLNPISGRGLVQAYSRLTDPPESCEPHTAVLHVRAGVEAATACAVSIAQFRFSTQRLILRRIARTGQ